MTKNFVLNETFSDLYEEVGGDLKLSAIFEAEELFKGQQASSEGYYEFYDALDVFNELRPSDTLRYSMARQVRERLEQIKIAIPNYDEWILPLVSEQVFELYLDYRAGPEALARVVEVEELASRASRYKSLGNRLFSDLDKPDRLQNISEHVESELLDKDFSDEWKTAWIMREAAAYTAWLNNGESRRKTALYLSNMSGKSVEEERANLGPSPAVQALINDKAVPGPEWWCTVTMGNIEDALDDPDIKDALIGVKFANTSSVGRNSALHLACMYADFEVMDALIDAGADVNEWNFDGTTPMHFVAALEGPSDVTRLEQKLQALLNAGAEMNRIDNWGQTPLHWACAHWYHTRDRAPLHLNDQQVRNKIQPAFMLLNAGADAKIRNKSGKTAWDLVQDGKKKFQSDVKSGLDWMDPYEVSDCYQLLLKTTFD